METFANIANGHFLSAHSKLALQETNDHHLHLNFWNEQNFGVTIIIVQNLLC